MDTIHQLMEDFGEGQEWVSEDGVSRMIVSITTKGACSRISYTIGKRKLTTYADGFAAWVHKTRASKK